MQWRITRHVLSSSRRRNVYDRTNTSRWELLRRDMHIYIYAHRDIYTYTYVYSKKKRYRNVLYKRYDCKVLIVVLHLWTVNKSDRLADRCVTKTKKKRWNSRNPILHNNLYFPIRTDWKISPLPYPMIDSADVRTVAAILAKISRARVSETVTYLTEVCENPKPHYTTYSLNFLIF